MVMCVHAYIKNRREHSFVKLNLNWDSKYVVHGSELHNYCTMRIILDKDVSPFSYMYMYRDNNNNNNNKNNNYYCYYDYDYYNNRSFTGPGHVTYPPLNLRCPGTL